MFNYIYYRVTRYYRQLKEGGEYILMGIIIVSILQFLNLLVILAFSSQFSHVVERLFINIKYKNNKIAFFLLITILLIFNYILYTKYINYTQLETKWVLKSDSEYKRYNLYVILYIFTSIVLAVITSKYIIVKI